MNIAFAGTPAFAAQHLERLIAASMNVQLVVTQPDRPGKRGKQLVAPPVKQAAQSAGIPVIQPDRLTAEHLAEARPDVLVVVAYGQILRAPVLALPTLGCVNVHASLLPRWRGAAPIQRAILAGDDATGVTIMRMDEGLDTGDMLAAQSIDIAPTDTAASLEAKMLDVGAPLLIDVLGKLQAGECKPQPQPEEGTTYAHKLQKAEALIDWHQDAAQVARHIRAFNPQPIAHSYLGELRVKFHDAMCAEGEGEPGKTLAVDAGGVTIACGTGAIISNAIQLPLGKGSILTGQDVLNARSDLVHAGARFANAPQP